MHPRLIGALALITQGLIEKRDGAWYDDIVLRDDVDTIYESLLRPDARLVECGVGGSLLLTSSLAGSPWEWNVSPATIRLNSPRNTVGPAHFWLASGS